MPWICQSSLQPEESETLIASDFSRVAEIELDPVCLAPNPMLLLHHLFINKCQKNKQNRVTYILSVTYIFLFRLVTWRHNANPGILPLMKITWGPTYEIPIVDLSTFLGLSSLMADPHDLRVELLQGTAKSHSKQRWLKTVMTLRGDII